MTNFPVPKDSYVAFDGLSIKDKIRQRLDQTGIFTDQSFEGSNLAAINDSFAMVVSLLLYQVNQESTQNKLSQTSLYKVANKIVKQLNYNPTGYQTSSVVFSVSSNQLSDGIYNIPRYTTVDVAGLNYSFNKDYEFSVSNTVIDDSNNEDNILYQGIFLEYPIVTPTGVPNEIITLNVDDSTLIDHFNIHVYVKENDVWQKWDKTESLFLNSFNDNVFEIRFNENKKYEIKFGDGVNGKQLTQDYQIAIYYLKTDGSAGEIGINALNNKKLSTLLTTQLSSILADVGQVSYISSSDLAKLKLSNSYESTLFVSHETVDSMRENAPKTFRSQRSLITSGAIETFVKSNFNNIINDVVVMNNKEYLDSYIKYFYDIGLTKPEFEGRALFNQIEFSDSCSFNNIYVFVVPKSVINKQYYLTPTLKKTIIQKLENNKVMTSAIIPSDPVYLSIDLGSNLENNSISKIQITKERTSRRTESSLKTEIENAILQYFDDNCSVLGSTINITELNTIVSAIEGVDSVRTILTSTGESVNGLNFVLWNPVYKSQTTESVNSVRSLEKFQYLLLNNKNFVDRIVVV